MDHSKYRLPRRTTHLVCTQIKLISLPMWHRKETSNYRTVKYLASHCIVFLVFNHSQRIKSLENCLAGNSECWYQVFSRLVLILTEQFLQVSVFEGFWWMCLRYRPTVGRDKLLGQKSPKYEIFKIPQDEPANQGLG